MLLALFAILLACVGWLVVLSLSNIVRIALGPSKSVSSPVVVRVKRDTALAVAGSIGSFRMGIVWTILVLGASIMYLVGVGILFLLICLTVWNADAVRIIASAYWYADVVFEIASVCWYVGAMFEIGCYACMTIVTVYTGFLEVSYQRRSVRNPKTNPRFFGTMPKIRRGLGQRLHMSGFGLAFA